MEEGEVMGEATDIMMTDTNTATITMTNTEPGSELGTLATND